VQEEKGQRTSTGGKTGGRREEGEERETCLLSDLAEGALWGGLMEWKLAYERELEMRFLTLCREKRGEE
jgi:hypothetical protein